MNAGKRESKGEFGLEYAYDDEHGYDLVGRPMRKKKKKKSVQQTRMSCTRSQK